MRSDILTAHCVTLSRWQCPGQSSMRTAIDWTMTTDHERNAVARFRTLLLIGPPGAGKGTLGRIFGQVPRFFFVSMGDLLRSVPPATKIGRQMVQQQQSGNLVPSESVISLWKEYMRQHIGEDFKPDCDTLVLDGLPRNVEQALWAGHLGRTPANGEPGHRLDLASAGGRLVFW